MNKKKLKTRYAQIDEEDNITGVYTESIVTDPAIESPFIALSRNEQEQMKFIVDKPQQKLTGPILIPDFPILRKDNFTGELYNLIFTKEEIVKIARKRAKYRQFNNINIEHKSDDIIDGAINEEFWIIEDPKNDKANALGLDLPAGTWMTSVYIPNLEQFNELKDNFNGFSIEGYFNIVDEEELQEEKLQSFNDYPEAVSENAKRGIRLNDEVNNRCATQIGKIRAQQLANKENISFETVKRMYSYLSRAKEYYNPNDTKACGTISYLLWGGEEALRWSERIIKQEENKNNQNKEQMKKNLIESLLEILKDTKKPVKQELSDYTLEDGTVVMVDDESMEATINGEPAPDGTHLLEDKIMAIVVQDGKLVEVIEIPKEEEIEESKEQSPEEIKQITYKLADGSEIFVREEDNLAFKGDEVAPDGEYELEDGRVLIIKDGRFVEVMEQLMKYIKQLTEVTIQIKEQLSELQSFKDEMTSKVEKLSKTTRAVSKPEISPSNIKTEVKQSDLMVNRLNQLLNSTK